jgi:hypothetical protein
LPGLDVRVSNAGARAAKSRLLETSRRADRHDSNNAGRPNKFAVITFKGDADVTIEGLAVDGREQGFLLAGRAAGVLLVYEGVHPLARLLK